MKRFSSNSSGVNVKRVSTMLFNTQQVQPYSNIFIDVISILEIVSKLYKVKVYVC